MELEIRHENLFNNLGPFIQCISSDFGCGRGIAVQFNELFGVKAKLKQQYPMYQWIGGDCIRINGVFNLITKRNYWEKPTYGTLTESLKKLKEQLLDMNISTIYAPKIGCGLDRLNWGNVELLIKEIFKDTDIKIIICVIE